MATRVRCLKCLKIIECSPYDTSVLLDHIRTNHPEIELPDDEMESQDNAEQVPIRWEEEDTRPESQLQTEGDLREETIRNIGKKPMYTRKYKMHTSQMSRSPQNRRMYRTSIEKWRPAKGTIFCPKCGVNNRPIVRSRSEKMSYSPAGAACILTCWPLCFLPCLFPSPAKEFLHCAECNTFLGMYDKQNNCVRPNRNFVDDRSSPGRLSDRQTEKRGTTSADVSMVKLQPEEPVPRTVEVHFAKDAVEPRS